MSPNRPLFDGRPIGSVEALSRALGVPLGRLTRVICCVDRLYLRRIWIRKPGRKPRPVFPASPELRDIQQRILDRVLKRVRPPPYLMGGIVGRSYVGNARRHAHATVLFGQDVEDFFPSISAQRVQFIFQDVLQFPPPVAQTLARLSTRKGQLVQGGVASTHIANLALYRTEPEFAERASKEGLRYTRFVDDVHVSSRHWIPPSVKTRLMGRMRSMLERQGYRPKRSKQFVAAQNGPMQVHRLNVNSSASSPRQCRQRLRNEVFLLERWADMEPWDSRLERAYLRVSARVGQLKQLNSGEWRRLRGRLKALESRRLRGLS